MVFFLSPFLIELSLGFHFTERRQKMTEKSGKGNFMIDDIQVLYQDFSTKISIDSQDKL
jgi:hypothetical protein